MIFTYSALTKQGTTEKDQVEAASYQEAIRVLHDKGIIPTEVKEKGHGLNLDVGKFFKGVSLTDKILFIQNLSIIMKAGVPLTKGLRILSMQTKNPRFKEALVEIDKQVEAGKSLSEALEKYPAIFSNLFVSMVRIGEISGNLDKNLEYLAVQLQREHDIVSKTKGAMIYPSVVIVTIISVGVVMSIFVLPQLTSIFKESNMQLPVLTRGVIAFSDFMSGHPISAIGGMIGFFAAIFYGLRTKAGSQGFDKVLLKIPIFGEIAKKINIARFSRIMSSMLKSGTPILEGLQICSQSLGNNEYRVAVADISEQVRIGKGFAVSMERYPKLFSYLVTQMVAVGEESGNVDSILEELAEHYEAEVDEVLRNLSSIIEPVLLLLIGAVVGLLAVALISPIYNLTNVQ